MISSSVRFPQRSLKFPTACRRQQQSAQEMGHSLGGDVYGAWLQGPPSLSLGPRRGAHSSSARVLPEPGSGEWRLLLSGVLSDMRDSTLKGSSTLLLLHLLTGARSSSSARSSGGADPCAGFMTHSCGAIQTLFPLLSPSLWMGVASWGES